MAERSIAVRLLAEVSNYVQGLQRAKAATGDLVTELSKSEQQRQNFQRLGTGMLVAGAGIAAGIGLATKAAIDWESSWAGVAKTVSGSEAQLAALEEELREMARTLPASHTEIAAVAEAAGQLGVATDDVAGFTRTMIQLGTATNLTAEEAAVAIAQMANVMGTGANEVDNLGAALVDLGNNSATTEADILTMAQRIAGAGATIGLTESDVLGFSAALASVGINAEAGGSAISRAMIDIETRVRAGGSSLQALADVAGMSAEDFRAAYEQDAAQAIATFIAGLGRMQASGEDVFAVLQGLGFTEIRLRDALLRLANSGDLLTRSLDTGATAWDENIALVEEAERRYGTTASQLQIAKNNLNDFAIEMGFVFIPLVAEAADKLGSFAGFLSDLPGPLLTAVGVTAALSAATLLLGGAAITAVTKIAAYKAALAQLEAQGGTSAAAVGKVSRGLRGGVVWAGRAIAAFAALQLAAAGVEAAFGQDLDAQIDALVVGLNRFAKDGDVAGEAARILGDDLEDLALAMRLLGPEGLGPTVGNAIKQIASPAEWAKAEGSVRHAKEEFQALDAAMAQLVESGKQETAAEVFRRLGKVAEENGVSTERLTELLPAYAAALEVAGEESEGTGEAIGGLGDQAAGAAEDVEALKAAFDRLFETQMDADRALIGYKQGLADLREQITSGTATLDVNTEAGRDNRSAVLDQIEAINELREANIDEGMALDDANEKYDKQLGKLEKVLIQAGFNEEAVRELIGAYRDIPDDVETEIEQPGMPRSIEDAERLRRHYHNLPPRVETRISAPGLSGVVDTVRLYAETLARLPRSVSTQVTQSRPGVQERWGGVTYRAQSGLLRANIFPPTAPARYAFAEPATGGEAFIPRRGDRNRSLAILSEAAGWYGARLTGVGGPWQWHGQRTVATSGGGGTTEAGGMFEGTLYLDSGELLGVVRGEIREHDRDLRRRVAAGPRRRV